MDIYTNLLNEYNRGKEERDSGKTVDTLPPTSHNKAIGARVPGESIKYRCH